MAVDTNQPIRSQDTGARQAMIPEDNTRLYAGTVVFRSSSGKAVGSPGDGTFAFAGIAACEIDNLLSPVAGVADRYPAGATFAVYQGGTFLLPLADAVQSTVGQKVYATDNYTFTTNPVGATLIGRCVGLASGMIAVMIDTSQTPDPPAVVAAARRAAVDAAAAREKADAAQWPGMRNQ